MAGRKEKGAPFEPRFESREALEQLLELSGSEASVEEVEELFKEAQAHGAQAGEVLPALFEVEPRFPDPSSARRLYQNLFGLWALVEQGKPLPQSQEERPPRVKKEKPVPPPLFGERGPDSAWVESAWKYLQDLVSSGDKELQRLSHAFENRQDAILIFLDGAGLSDNGFAQARYLLFELFAMIELGRARGVHRVSREELQTPPPVAMAVPEALGSYVDEVLFEAEQDEEAPLSAAESRQVRELVAQCLQALWA